MPHDVSRIVDARTWGIREKRAALVRFDDAVITFTAMWPAPSTLVQRPDGTHRRKYAVHLLVPAEHRELPFHQMRELTLQLTGGRHPLHTTDIDGVRARDAHGVTIVAYIDDWR